MIRYRLKRIKKHNQTYEDRRMARLIERLLYHKDPSHKVILNLERKCHRLQDLGVTTIDTMLTECLKALDKMEHDLLATMTSNDAFMVVK